MSPQQALHRFDPRLAASLGTMQQDTALGEMLAEGGSAPHVLALANSQPSPAVSKMRQGQVWLRRVLRFCGCSESGVKDLSSARACPGQEPSRPRGEQFVGPAAVLCCYPGWLGLDARLLLTKPQVWDRLRHVAEGGSTPTCLSWPIASHPLRSVTLGAADVGWDLRSVDA